MVQEADLTSLDMRKIVKKLKEKYGVKGRVVAVDYGSDVKDLFVRFSHEPIDDGEPSEDGLLIFHYHGGRLVAVEILDLEKFMSSE